MRGTDRGHDAVVSVVRANAASLLKVARLHSLCADDAQDAYQRALVIYLERADRIDPATAGSYLRTVVKHEAMAIRESRQLAVVDEEVDFDAYCGDVGDPDERAEAFDRVARAAEALRECKHDEVVALLLRAEGNSYAEIGQLTGWSATKVNRCLAEGRASFIRRYAAIESGEACDRWAPVLSALVDGRAKARDLSGVRGHLRNCPACRVALRALYETPPVLAALLPAGLLFASPPVSDAGARLLTRIYEAIAGGAGEKVTAGALKFQAAFDAMATGKVVAVAASAAALAGGGALSVDGAVREPNRERSARVERRAETPRVSSIPAQRPRANPSSRVSAPVLRTAAAASPRPKLPLRAAAVAHEFGPEATATSHPTNSGRISAPRGTAMRPESSRARAKTALRARATSAEREYGVE